MTYKYTIYNKTTGEVISTSQQSDELKKEDIVDPDDELDFVEGLANVGIEKVDIDTKKFVEIVYTTEEIAAHDKELLENKWILFRVDRNSFLQESDWIMASDSPLSDSKTEEWKTYRQTLRDLPANTSDIDDINWPTKPT